MTNQTTTTTNQTMTTTTQTTTTTQPERYARKRVVFEMHVLVLIHKVTASVINWRLPELPSLA